MYLSAGVYVTETDNSAIVPNVSTAMGFFAGEFEKGPLEQPFVITNKDELEIYFGKPTDENYNQWFQCYKFFDYSNQLTISRAYSTDVKTDTGATVTLVTGAIQIVNLTEAEIEHIQVGSKLQVENNPEEMIVKEMYQQQDLDYTVVLVDPLSTDLTGTLYVFSGYKNAGIDAYQEDSSANYPAVNQTYDLYKNYDDFMFKQDSISFDSGVKLKFIARDPGTEGNDIEIAIAGPTDFEDYVDNNGNRSVSKAEAFEGVSLVSLFDYPPLQNQYAIMFKDTKTGEMESFLVSFDKEALDGNNKSLYVETVINENSNMFYVVDNEAISDTIQLIQPSLGGDVTYNTLITPHLFKDSQSNMPGQNATPIMSIMSTAGGLATPISIGDLYNAYFEVENKELYDIDVVIGNEFDEGDAALTLANDREDCIAFVGARYGDVVGKRSAEAVRNIVDWVKGVNGGPLRTMFGAVFANYFKIYDNYARKYRYINVAGDMAGLRCQTNTDQASWWASAGLQRGQILNIDRISFSPNQDQRDLLYKENANPIVNFPGQGNLCWGQKTLLNYSSSFDRINVRGLFNTIERAMAKAAKSSVFEFNDVYTRNNILAMFNPFLASVKAGRGIADFLVICDETNNTPDVISRNELVVDIYIKPAYAAEFIKLNFVNVGTRSFATVLGQ